DGADYHRYETQGELLLHLVQGMEGLFEGLDDQGEPADITPLSPVVADERVHISPQDMTGDGRGTQRAHEHAAVVAPTLPLLRVRVLAPRLAERTALAVEEEDVDRETVGELHAAETAGDLDRVRPVVAPEEGADHRSRAAVADRCRELDPARPPGGGRRR